MNFKKPAGAIVSVTVSPPTSPPVPVDTLVSAVAGPSLAVIGDVPLRTVLDGIKSGRWRERVEAVRAAYTAGGKEASGPLKKTLGGFIAGGTFSYRNNESINQRSGMIAVDVDFDVNPGLVASVARDRIATSPHCVAACVSPSGNGVKAIFRCDATRPHPDVYRACEAYFLSEYNLVTDPKCKDVSRCCYYSYDPEAFIASGPVAPIPCLTQPAPTMDPVPAAAAPTPAPTTPAPTAVTKEDVREVLRAIETRPGYDDWLRVISAVASVLPEEEGIRLLKEWSPEEVPGEYKDKWAHALGDVGIGTLIYFAKENGWVPSAAFRRKMSDTAVREAARLALLAKLSKCEFGLGVPPVKPEPRFVVAGVPVSTPGNITTISAQAKAGKSALIGAFVAATVVAEVGGHESCTSTAPDCLGVTAAEPEGRKLLHFDTEQSPSDHWQGNKRALARAGVTERPPWFRSFGLAGSGPREIVEAVRLVAEIEAAGPGVFAIIVDGVADMVSDVNEAVECNALIAGLHDLAIRYDCPIVCVVHENPTQTTGKSRGHLGSQLERKSETNLRLVRKGEITQVFADKCRGAPIQEKHGPCFSWNESVSMHVSVPTSAARANDKKTADLRELAEECIPEAGALNAVGYTALRGAIVAARGWGVKAAEKKIKAMQDAGVITKDGSHYFREHFE